MYASNIYFFFFLISLSTAGLLAPVGGLSLSSALSRASLSVHTHERVLAPFDSSSHILYISETISNRCKFEASKCATIFCRIRSQSSLPLPCPTLPLSVRPCDTASPGSIPLSFAESFECGEAEKLKRAKVRWGIVPVDILEGQAPPMLTACVRETLKERKEAQSELKKQLQDKGDGGIRLCVHPVIISTTNGFPLMLSLLVIVFVATKEHVVQLKRQKFLDKYTSTNVGKSS